METKPLLFGIIGFLVGGLLVSIAAVTVNKPDTSTSTSMSMNEVVTSLQDKSGDAYDEAFISEMIDHHQGAINMAQLSERQAKHQEIKDLSKTIITAQEKEIAEMRRWQKMWDYENVPASGDTQ